MNDDTVNDKLDESVAFSYMVSNFWAFEAFRKA